MLLVSLGGLQARPSVSRVPFRFLVRPTAESSLSSSPLVLLLLLFHGRISQSRKRRH